jgi:transmembrane sensor
MTQDVEQQAIEWRIRLAHGGADDWEAFIAWLEADPAHSDAYDRVGIADISIEPDQMPIMSSTSNDDDPQVEDSAPVTRPFYLKWSAVAAAVVLLVILGLSPMFRPGAARYEVASAPGMHMNVDFGDGSHAELNGSTRLVLDRNDKRYAELVSGEATFFVRHDASKPFTVAVGDDRIQDLGTAFNVVREPTNLAVEVIEGKVLYNPGKETISLTAGQTLTIRSGDDTARIGRMDPEAMGGWRHNMLSYSATPLMIVAEDLSRNLGTKIDVDPQIASQPFTGSVRLDADRSATLQNLASILNLDVRQRPEGWRIEPRQRAHR